MNSKREATFLCRTKNKTVTTLAVLAIITICLSEITVFAQETQLQPGDLEALKDKGVLQANIFPVNPQTDNPRKFHYELTPGDSITDTLLIVNLSEKINNLKIYPTHNIAEENNAVTYAVINEDGKKEFSEWTTLETEEIALEPNENRELDYTITIPADTPQGLYKGGFSIERFIQAPEGTMLNTSFRKVYGVEINVTNNPAPFKEFTANVFELPVYFWPALALFGLSIIYYLFSKIKGKKKTHAN